MSHWGKRDDTIVHEIEPFNAEPAPDALGETRLTPTDAFYSRNHGPIPEVDPAAWRLQVDGAVRHPVQLSLDDLRTQFQTHHVTATLQCAGNRRVGFIEVADIPGEDPWRGGAIGTATWAGARLRDVIAAVGAAEQVTDVAFQAPDVSRIASPPQAYGSSIPISKARQPEVLLAWEMNGEPLNRVHGAPVRVVVPSYIGARSVKWIDRISLQDEPSANYFQATAYRILAPGADAGAAGSGDGISLGPWSLNSEILSPADGATVHSGRHVVSGYAVAAEHRRVVRVEVSTDAGQGWADAELEPDDQPWTWRRWRLDVELEPGSATLLARAWDDSGAQQPSDPAALWNPKGYANTSWARARLDVGSAPTGLA
ncbi:MAG: sulfite oxidase [Marmoricola sp.]